MTSAATLQPDPAPITACTVSRDVQQFDMLIDEMERELGEAWGDLTFGDAVLFLGQPDVEQLEFFALAINADDEGNLDQIAEVIQQAHAADVGVILVADNVSPTALHRLMRLGADDFLPYPLPDGALSDAIARLRATALARKAPQKAAVPQAPAPQADAAQMPTPAPVPKPTPEPTPASAPLAATPISPAPAAAPIAAATPPAPAAPAAAPAPTATPRGASDGQMLTFRPRGDRQGLLLPIHGMAGGTGGTTFAANLAWELAHFDKASAPRVCLFDLDFQFGAVATYLDLPRRDAVFEVLTDPQNVDPESLLGAMQVLNDRLHVFTAPSDMLPLDIISPEDLGHLLDMALANFDFVLIDMPKTVVVWTEAVLSRAHLYFSLIDLDLRSAQNVLRYLRALKAEGLPHDKLRFVLNRAPKFTDLSGRSRVKRMAESLDIAIDIQLPDGGSAVTQANDHGLPLAESAAKNPLRKELQKLAKSLIDQNKSAQLRSA